ncbi:MAG: M28 family peptidase [Planctomycetes bacterium]|nr:M28 family peptidase [Planctomycetota bacterium]
MGSNIVWVFVLFVSFLFFGGCASVEYSYPEVGVSGDNLRETVGFLTEIKPARNYQNLRSLEKAAGYISDKFAEYGFKPKRQEFGASGQTYCNIIVSAGTSEDARQVFVIGAHYDVAGDQPGADDNASAVAGLLEIARFAKKYEDQLPCRIEFVAYSLEEPPFFGTDQMGSYVHAKSLHDKDMKVKGMISLEMIGYFTDVKGSQKYPIGLMGLFYPSEGNFIGVISNYKSGGLKRHTARHMKAASIKVRTLAAPSFVQGVDFSDQRNYWKFGYKAVMVTDTAFYRNPNYHQTTDTIDTLSFDKMKEVVKGVCWALLNL